MLPNRESGPQNQPKAKVAVSILAGMCLSMGGTLPFPPTGFSAIAAIAPILMAIAVPKTAHIFLNNPERSTVLLRKLPASF